MTKKIIYIAGPITGVPGYWDAFQAAEEELRSEGFVPLNPAALSGGMTPRHYMRICLPMLLTADGVLLLKGWGHSRGARLESTLANYVGLPIADSVGGLKNALRKAEEAKA